MIFVKIIIQTGVSDKGKTSLTEIHWFATIAIRKEYLSESEHL